MTETEQRFTLHARSRNIARTIGYPAGVGLLVAAVFGPFGDTSGDWFFLRPVCGIFGLGTLIWAWPTDRRCRIEVAEQHVTVVNTFARYVVAWRALSDIEFEEIGNTVNQQRLVFVTPNKRIVAEAPWGSEDELMTVRDRILHARELSPNDPQSDVGVAVKGAPALADRFGARFPRVKKGLVFTGAVLFVVAAVAVTLVFGFGLIILVLDLILGDWLVAHVPFWDELIDLVVGNS